MMSAEARAAYGDPARECLCPPASPPPPPPDGREAMSVSMGGVSSSSGGGSGVGGSVGNPGRPHFSISSILGLDTSQRLRPHEPQSPPPPTPYTHAHIVRPASPACHKRSPSPSPHFALAREASAEHAHTRSPPQRAASPTYPLYLGEGSHEASAAHTPVEHLHSAHDAPYTPTDDALMDDDEEDDAGSGDEDEEGGGDPPVGGGEDVGGAEEARPHGIDIHHNSAFVRPTPLHLRPDVEGVEAVTSLGGGVAGPLGGGPLNPAAHLPPLWYPPWVAAFKPTFGLQGRPPPLIPFRLHADTGTSTLSRFSSIPKSRGKQNKGSIHSLQ